LFETEKRLSRVLHAQGSSGKNRKIAGQKNGIVEFYRLENGQKNDRFVHSMHFMKRPTFCCFTVIGGGGKK
jgi:hypothetical protein